MVAWRVFAGDDEAWERERLSLPDHCVFQSAAWARHKAASGWTALRLLSPRASAQFLVKKLPGGARLLWARGGPCGEPGDWDAGLRAAATKAAGGLLVYGRFCCYRERRDEDARRLTQAGFAPAARPLNKPASFALDLTRGEKALQEGLSPNWAHNLRRGLKRCAVRVWENASGADLAPVYRAMEAYKGLDAAYDETSLSSLLKSLGPSALLWRADDENGKPIAFRACAVEKGRAWDLLAASTPEGRKRYASYALLWALLTESARRGARTYDLGGADPVAAKGVHDFKKGTGAAAIEYLGEWEWAAPSWSRRAASAAVARLSPSA